MDLDRSIYIYIYIYILCDLHATQLFKRIICSMSRSMCSKLTATDHTYAFIAIYGRFLSFDIFSTL